MTEIQTKLAGVTFEDAQENIKKFGVKDVPTYALVREPNNPHDPNAIRVSLGGIIFMGYVPKEIARDLALKMDAGKVYLAFFVKRNESPMHSTVGLTVRVEETEPVRIPKEETLPANTESHTKGGIKDEEQISKKKASKHSGAR
jgi:hypothetical protein